MFFSNKEPQKQIQIQNFLLFFSKNPPRFVIKHNFLIKPRSSIMYSPNLTSELRSPSEGALQNPTEKKSGVVNTRPTYGFRFIEDFDPRNKNLKQ